MSTDPLLILNNIPPTLRNPLILEYLKILKNFRESRWEPAELDGGKLCEIIYCIIKGYTISSFPNNPYKPLNMVDDCKNLEKADPKKYCRALRIQIPRILIALYEIRNNRGVGHCGGDVDPNLMDATIVLAMSKWLIAELIRIFHNVDVHTATQAVNSITERTLPIIWEIDGKKRVLNPHLPKSDQTLLILYSTIIGARDVDLFQWVNYATLTLYRRNILMQLHDDRLIEFDDKKNTAKISPTGISYVENKLNLELKT